MAEDLPMGPCPQEKARDQWPRAPWKARNSCRNLEGSRAVDAHLGPHLLHPGGDPTRIPGDAPVSRPHPGDVPPPSRTGGGARWMSLADA